MAYAPFCDITASSDDAPPPLMPVADIRFEADRDVFVWTWCAGAMGEAVTEARSQTSNPGLAPTQSSGAPEFGVVWGAAPHVAQGTSQRMLIELPRQRGPSGYAPSVYRPPR